MVVLVDNILASPAPRCAPSPCGEPAQSAVAVALTSPVPCGHEARFPRMCASIIGRRGLRGGEGYRKRKLDPWKMPSSTAWERFLAFTSHARTKPSFDGEDCQYRLDIAERMSGLLRALAAGASLPAFAETIFEGEFAPFRPYLLTLEKQNEWLNHWASLDEASLRTAIMGFLDEEEDADTQVCALRKHGRGTPPRTPASNSIIATSSVSDRLFNFAIDRRRCLRSDRHSASGSSAAWATSRR